MGKDWNLISELLINLRYLIKHYAFKEEQECRIIRVVKTEHGDIKQDGNKMYVHSTNIKNHVKKIYFGPCANKITDNRLPIDVFQNKLNKMGLGEIICEESGLPYYVPTTDTALLKSG